MIASAPGKLVLSGAYVVLDGAPAIVAAVSRRAFADSQRPAAFVAPEIAAAFKTSTPPYVDVGALREKDRKLGLGSSAAALVAALATRGETLDRDRILRDAFDAHRRVQGGGSGIDVVASTFGGVLVCTIERDGPPRRDRVTIPSSLVIEAWACPSSASTASLLGTVRDFRADSPAKYDGITAPGAEAARGVVHALGRADVSGVVAGLREQFAMLLALDDATGVGIVPSYLRELDALAERDASVMLPSGAGGGDVALHVGPKPSHDAFRARAAALGLKLLDLALGAPGVRREPSAETLLSTSQDLLPT